MLRVCNARYCVSMLSHAIWMCIPNGYMWWYGEDDTPSLPMQFITKDKQQRAKNGQFHCCCKIIIIYTISCLIKSVRFSTCKFNLIYSSWSEIQSIYWAHRLLASCQPFIDAFPMKKMTAWKKPHFIIYFHDFLANATLFFLTIRKRGFQFEHGFQLQLR